MGHSSRTRGVYAHPILPDFMVFLNWKELPVFWYGFQHFPYALLMVVLVPGALAFVFGWFAFRSRVTGVYLSIITQALTFALMLGFFRNNFGFGGNNGLTDFKDILGFNVQAQSTRAALFAISVAALILGFLICRTIITSKLGMVLVSIRDAETRTRFLGYRVESYKLFVFTLSACMAGVAGALYVPQVDRSRDLGRGRRAWHAGRRRDRCDRGELRQDHIHVRLARALLAVPARWSVRAGDAAAAAWHRGHLEAFVGETSRSPAGGRGRARRSRRAGRAETRGVSEWRTAPPPRCCISMPSRYRSTASAR
jgi:hypothetical protein